MGTYQHDYAAFGELVLCAPWMVAEMRSRAERGLAVAEMVAPVGSPAEGDEHAGRYKASFSVDSGIQVHATRRAYGELSNSAPEALYVEFGTRNNPAYRVLGRAMEAMR